MFGGGGGRGTQRASCTPAQDAFPAHLPDTSLRDEMATDASAPDKI